MQPLIARVHYAPQMDTFIAPFLSGHADLANLKRIRDEEGFQPILLATLSGEWDWLLNMYFGETYKVEKPYMSP